MAHLAKLQAMASSDITRMWNAPQGVQNNEVFGSVVLEMFGDVVGSFQVILPKLKQEQLYWVNDRSRRSE